MGDSWGASGQFFWKIIRNLGKLIVRNVVDGKRCVQPLNVAVIPSCRERRSRYLGSWVGKRGLVGVYAGS